MTDLTDEDITTLTSEIENNERDIASVDADLTRLRKRWNDFLVQMEDIQVLKEDLSSLFTRVNGEALNYELFLKQIEDLHTNF